MNSVKYSAAVIGLGNIGLLYDINTNIKKKHCFSHTSAYLKHPNIDLLGGVDPQKENGELFSKITNRPYFTEIENLLDKLCPDIVSITAPTNKHLSVLKNVAPHKPKLIVLEKPLATNEAEVYEIIKLQKKYDLKILVNYYRGYLPTVKKIQESFKSGKYGKLQTGHVLYVKGLLNNSSHYINLLLHFFGKPEDYSITNHIDSYNDDPTLEFILKYKNFNISFQAVSNSSYTIGEVDLLFEKIRIKFINLFKDIVYCNIIDSPDFTGYRILNDELTSIEDEYLNYMFYVIDHAYESLDKNKDISNDFEIVVQTTEICNELLKKY